MTAPPSQLPGSGSSIGDVDGGMNLARFVDSGRPMKSLRNPHHQTVHGSSSGTGDSAAEYRYETAYGPVSGASGGMTSSVYGVDSPTPAPSSHREYYSAPTTWATTAGEARSTIAYSSGEGQPNAFSTGAFKPSGPGTPSMKPGSEHGPGHDEYSGTSRSSFDTMNNYSWRGS